MKKENYVSIINCTNDWFRISVEHSSMRKGLDNMMNQIEKGDFDTTRCVMSRVIHWAVKTTENGDFFEGIDSIGSDHDDGFIDNYYVHGDDISPIGKTWKQVFNDTPSFNWGLKVIPNFIDGSNFNPKGFSIKPIIVDVYQRNPKKGMDCDYAEGKFSRNSEFTFEIFFEDQHSEDTYKATRIAEMYIKSGDVIQWSWAGPPLDKEPDWEFGEQLLADLLVGIQSFANTTPIDHLKKKK